MKGTVQFAMVTNY